MSKSPKFNKGQHTYPVSVSSVYYVSDTTLNSISNENTNNTQQNLRRIQITSAYKNEIEENGGKGKKEVRKSKEDREQRKRIGRNDNK